MLLYLGGFLLWGVAYAILVVRIPRHGFVEIQAFRKASSGRSMQRLEAAAAGSRGGRSTYRRAALRE